MIAIDESFSFIQYLYKNFKNIIFQFSIITYFQILIVLTI